MASALSWLDHDATASQRSMHLLSLFQEKESRDELGIGGIRDAIADQLFPGTSTIQTRLRYVLFIPWLFSQAEAKQSSASGFHAATKQAENQLLAALIENEPANEPGVIGREAGSSLKRLPSSVYWFGLGSWGLRNFDGSLQQFFAQVETRHATRRARRRRDDGDQHDGDPQGDPWHPQLAKLCPQDFPGGAKLALSHSEAAFLLDRWRHAHPNSLLTWLALDLTHRDLVPDSTAIWLYPLRDRFPQPIGELVEHARRFNLLQYGAALLYNLQLAQLDRREELAAKYDTELLQWSSESAPQCLGWDLRTFWPRVVGKGHTVTERTREFIEQWLALATGTPVLASSSAARRLVELRERGLKRARSRFDNHAARAQWSGRAGLEPLAYRWPTASTFLRDWHAGWRQA